MTVYRDALQFENLIQIDRENHKDTLREKTNTSIITTPVNHLTEFVRLSGHEALVFLMHNPRLLYSLQRTDVVSIASTAPQICPLV
jgi:hypothetical protein